MTEALTLRPATPADAGLLFGWVNRPDSLAGKIRTQGPIPREAHMAWYAARLADPATLIQIVENQSQPIGQIRLSETGEDAEIDIYILAEARGQGLAAKALGLAIAAYRAGGGAKTPMAMVKADNMPSQRLFERAGFRLCESGEHRVYRLEGSPHEP